MKVAFLVNDKNMASIMKSYLKNKNTFGDEINIFVKGENKDLSSYLIIKDDLSKKDALMLDLVGNYRTHGLPSNPKVRAKGEKESKSEGEPSAKVCEECLEVIPVGDKICPACGHVHVEEVEEVDARQKLVEVEAKDERLTLVRWWEKPKVSKMGYAGVLFVAKVQERDKPLFKSATNGTAKQGKIREQLKELKAGDKIEIVNTPYGDWIA